MRKMWVKLFTTAALACMLCLSGLVMSGEAQARFTDNGDGTVTDTVAKLMWTKDASPFGMLNWEDAWFGCRSHRISGFLDWRLPSRDELVALYQAIQGENPFTVSQSSIYWSSTEVTRDVAWYVSMDDGWNSIIDKAQPFYVWPVRGPW